MNSILASAGASNVSYQLGQNSKNLQKSVQRLSSMLRINSSADDPAGLALSMKLGMSIRKTEAMLSTVSNTSSFLQVQDGVLGVADDILQRMSELAIYSKSVTATSSDRAAYDEEFQDLNAQLTGMLSETFNGINLFTDGGSTTINSTQFEATISLTGQTIGISQADLGAVTEYVELQNVLDTAAAASADTAIDNAIVNLAALRATNGSEQNRVNFATDLLSVNKLNLEAANSRVVDLDYASEMLNYTKLGIIQDSNIALLAQANTRSENILRLLD